MTASSENVSRVYNHLHHLLSSRQRLLEQGEIEAEVNRSREMIDRVGPALFGEMLPERTPVEQLSDSQWDEVTRKLESHFNVKLPGGKIVLGEDQAARDLTWWTDKVKIRKTPFYWDRYQRWIRKSLPPDVVNTVDQDTDRVLNNLGDPSTDSFLIRGMVVGHVQSGKTGNYSALVCKAADAGYKFIVVIAGGTDSLRDQTQERLNEAFVGAEEGKQVGAGIGFTTSGTLPVCLTTKDRDFNKQDANRMSQGINFDNISTPILIVIKKNPRSLQNVIDWLKAQYRNVIPDHAMLVIDDESDYASINYNSQEDPTVINKSIRELLTLFKKGTYVAYTATPFANIFIDHQAGSEEFGQDLFPKDFIFALDAPSNYFGARRIFLETDGRHLVEIPQEEITLHLPLKHKKDHDLTISPSLKDAIRLFILNVGIRKLRGQEDKHNSMLIHVSRFTRIHGLISAQVGEYFDEVKRDLSVYGKLSDGVDRSRHIRDLHETFQERLKDNPETTEEWADVIFAATDMISTILIREAHQKSRVRVVYRKDSPTNAIVIGGASLSRGYTLEGLSVSYFLRNTLFYDTLMQMGRWFGYRPGYEDLCRIYLSDDVITHFRNIILASEDLFGSIGYMAENHLTPLEFGLAVKRHPESALQITARNKQKNVKNFPVDMSLDGHLKETARFSLLDEDNRKNREVIEWMVNSLGSWDFRNPGSIVWKEVDSELVREFLTRFKVFTVDRYGLLDRMPIPFIRQFAADRTEPWDVALFSGEGESASLDSSLEIRKSRRKIVPKDGYVEVKNRQVSTGTSEAVSLGEAGASLGSDRVAARKLLPRPLLMLHLIQGSDQKEYPAFGVSFPGDARESTGRVTLMVNTVYMEKLEEELLDKGEDYD